MVFRTEKKKFRNKLEFDRGGILLANGDLAKYLFGTEPIVDVLCLAVRNFG